jgi:hypothetical protein
MIVITCRGSGASSISCRFIKLTKSPHHHEHIETKNGEDNK